MVDFGDKQGGTISTPEQRCTVYWFVLLTYAQEYYHTKYAEPHHDSRYPPHDYNPDETEHHAHT
jgi:hypothetical protein